MVRVAFLRAVNLGRRRVAMARLAEVVRELGYDDVWTHINSGNVVFEGTGSRRTSRPTSKPRSRRSSASR